MKLDEFLALVLPEVIGCPQPLAQQAIMQAASDFCRETLAWTEIQDPEALIDGTNDYELTAPSGAYVYTVRDVWIGAQRLTPITLRELASTLPNWQAAKGVPAYYNQAQERGVIRLYPTPANLAGATITVRSAYVPKMTAITLPDFLGRSFISVIASGAKASLMRIQETPWSNPGLSEFYRQSFADGIAKAKAEESHDRVPGSIKVMPRSFGF